MMPVTDTPKYLMPKRLANNTVAYYWSPPKRVMDELAAAGMAKYLPRRSLGTDLAHAQIKAKEYSDQYDFWRVHRRLPDQQAAKVVIPGTVEHLFETYKAAQPFQKRSYNNLPPKTKKDYDRRIKRLCGYVLKDGRRLGGIMARDIDAPFADALYGKLLPSADGKLARRSANLTMAVFRRAWNAAHRATPEHVPATNPFAKMRLDHSAAETVPATYEQLLAFEAKAIEMGEPIPAFVARCAWELLQRIDEIVTTFAWTHWRPEDHPNEVYGRFGKNDNPVWKPVGDKSGPFYAELEERLAAVPRHGTTVCLIEHRKGPKPAEGKSDARQVVYKPMTYFYLSKRAKAIRKAAGLPAHVTLTSFRHGGLTELGNAGLPDTLALAQSRHKKRETLSRYIHRTGEQIAQGSRLRLAHRRGEQ